MRGSESLFSEELGTRLTGRYIPLKIFPFSFYEFARHRSDVLIDKKVLSTTEVGKIKKIFNEYCHLGGFPAYVENQDNDYLHALYESILYRDIIVRHKIPNPAPMKELIFYLASNCSKEITYNALRKLLKLGSVTTVSDYCAYLENSYLCFFVSRYSESVKVQMQAPKKVYFIDHAFAKIIGFRFSEDFCRMLENIVFIELKRQAFEIFYHQEKKECDFIVREKGKVIMAVQVCHSLENAQTKQRELEGLLEALGRFSLTEGILLTSEAEETLRLQHQNRTYIIKIIPLWKWLLKQY